MRIFFQNGELTEKSKKLQGLLDFRRKDEKEIKMPLKLKQDENRNV